jgi:hypothetical protein
VTKYIQEKARQGDDGGGEEEEEEEERADDDALAQSLADGAASTLLLGDTGTFMAGGAGTFMAAGGGTFVAGEGTMVAQGGGGGGLGDVKLTFVDNPPPKIAQAQKRNFGHFSDRDLKLLLQSVKGVAQSAIASGAAPASVIANYEDVRKGVVKELQRRKPDTPDDYEVLTV